MSQIKQFVVWNVIWVNEKEGLPFETLSGVPQGSILGPLLSLCRRNKVIRHGWLNICHQHQHQHGRQLGWEKVLKKIRSHTNSLTNGTPVERESVSFESCKHTGAALLFFTGYGDRSYISFVLWLDLEYNLLHWQTPHVWLMTQIKRNKKKVFDEIRSHKGNRKGLCLSVTCIWLYPVLMLIHMQMKQFCMNLDKVYFHEKVWLFALDWFCLWQCNGPFFTADMLTCCGRKSTGVTVTEWQWVSTHSTRTLRPAKPIQPSFIVLFTPVLLLLWHVKMFSVGKSPVVLQSFKYYSLSGGVNTPAKIKCYNRFNI